MSVGQGQEQTDSAAVQEPEHGGESSPSEAGEQIRTLDFSQPTKFTTELRRRIIRALHFNGAKATHQRIFQRLLYY